MMKLVACQMVSTPDIATNLDTVDRLLSTMMPTGDQPVLVTLPEACLIFGGDVRANLQHQEALGDGPMQAALGALAQKYGIWLATGTIPTRSDTYERFHATTCVFNPQGELKAHYQKMHLFDVDVNDNTGAYRESDTTAAGQRVVVFDAEGITVGLAVCYDVRFAALFGHLAARGAEVVLLPSAFTVPTGEAHWEVLLRARAIEHQFYLVAPGQGGTHPNGRQTWGHSMIINPWGDIMARAAYGEARIDSEFDPQVLAEVRRKMPVGQHNRFENGKLHEPS